MHTKLCGLTIYCMCIAIWLYSTINFSLYSSTDSWHQLTLHGVKSTGKEIGRGAYGRVFEVEYKNTQYAAKEVHALLLEYAQNDQNALQKITDSFFNECHIWSQLEHPCIVQFVG